MTRLQATLVVVLVTLAAVVAGQAAWGVLGPAVASARTAVPALAGAVPAWAWWSVFGVAMTLRCAGSKTRGCGRVVCGSHPSAA